LTADDPNPFIESPGFSTNSSYNVTQQCLWTISNRGADGGAPSGGTSIVIRFTDLDLETHGSCVYDFVELREGNVSSMT
jgi:cubilin